MKFVNKFTHPVSLVDGREVGGLGECELTKEQYEVPEQWRHLPDLFVGASPAAEKLIAEAADNPAKFDNEDTAEPVVSVDNGGMT